jgi:diguanylate cyclase
MIEAPVMMARFLRRFDCTEFVAVLRSGRADGAPAIFVAAAATLGLLAGAMILARPHFDQNASSLLVASFLCFASLVFLALRAKSRAATGIIAEKPANLQEVSRCAEGCSPWDRIDFVDRLAAVIEEAGRAEAGAAALLIEIDGFKDVNLAIDPEVANTLAVAVAKRIARSGRADNFVARIDEDQFGVVAPDVSTPKMSQLIAERMVEALRAPYHIMGRGIFVNAHVGVVLIDGQSGDAAKIMRCADVALSQAKRQESTRVCVYDADIDVKLSDQRQLEQDLSEAIRNNGLRLVYQPIVDRTGETMLGVEALCRWQHASRGDVSPERFVPLAETTGLVVSLGEWVLRQACQEAVNWPGLKIAVNVSPHQFRCAGFVDFVLGTLAETGLEPTRLELELTESILVNDLEDVKAKMLQLKDLGIRLALDDFGTGYSSLSYLLSLPFDKLKIDRSFVFKVESGVAGAAIVHSIVSLGRALGMHVTAEGVDSEKQREFLRIAGVHSFQGFLFARPVEAPAITERLAAQTSAPPIAPHAILPLAG